MYFHTNLKHYIVDARQEGELFSLLAWSYLLDSSTLFRMPQYLMLFTKKNKINTSYVGYTLFEYFRIVSIQRNIN